MPAYWLLSIFCFFAVAGFGFLFTFAFVITVMTISKKLEQASILYMVPAFFS